MNRISIVVRYMLACMLVAFALPSFGASTKVFFATFPQFITGGTGVQIPVTFHNATPPPGVSNINSLQIVAPPGVTITNVSPGVDTAIGGGINGVIVTDFAGIRRGTSFTFTVTVDVTGSCVNGTWGVEANTGNAFPKGDPFTLIPGGNLNSACDGVLSCEDVGTPFSFGGGNASGFRGTHNKDGSACVPVAFDFNNEIATLNKVTLVWDTNAQPGAAFSVSATWKPEYVNTVTGLASRSTKVQWFVNGVPTPSQPVAGRACLSQNLPAPFGVLDTGIGTGNLSISFPGGPTTPGTFPIAIGSERLHATYSGSGTVYNVTRGQGGTTAAAHLAGAPVMSNPLPLDGSGNQMQMCIWDEGWVSVTSGSPDCTPANPLLACVQYTTSIFDIGDGVIVRDE